MLARSALRLGILVPVLYFGVQLLAARFYRGYSFATQLASELGSPRSGVPSIFNSGMILTGVMTIIAAAAFPSALRRANCHPALAWLTAAALVSMGLGSIWAGTFPLPDPRHNPRLLGAGIFLVPLLFPLAVLRKPDARALKIYLFVNLGLYVLLLPVLGGDRAILQRVAAAVVYVPVGVLSAALGRDGRVGGAGTRSNGTG